MRSIFILTLTFFTLGSFGQNEHHCSNKSKYLNSFNKDKRSFINDTEAYDVKFYKLDLQIENNSIYIEGNMTIRAVENRGTSTALDTFEFELHSNYTIDSIVVNNIKSSFSRNSHLVSVKMSPAIPAGGMFDAVIYYSGTAPSGGSSAIGNGLSTGTSPSWGNSVTWSLSQPYSAYEWFPVKQALQDKADSVEVWITTDSSNLAGSNGILQNVTTIGSKKRFEWKSTYPIAYYLISIAVAQYDEYTIYAKPQGMTDSIEIVNYIYNNPGTLPNFKDEIDKTVDMMNLYSELFGLYPFREEKYGHCMAPFSGGMEHQTMTSQGYFVTDLTSHELAHQWFGDDVTCNSWEHIWLNEGFASYLEYLFIEEFEPGRATNWINATHNSALNPNGSVFVDDTTSVGRIFSGSLTYNKGAFLLHMLRREMNDDSLFIETLRQHRQTYTGSNANTTQFKAIAENVSGMNFDVFFDQWFYGEGYPIIGLKYNHDDGLVLKLEQEASTPLSIPLFETYVDVNLFFNTIGDTTLRLWMDKDEEVFYFPEIQGTVLSAEIDRDQWLLNDIGLISYDPTLSTQEIETQVAFEVFPNPANTILNIRGLDDDFERIEIHNVDGKLVDVFNSRTDRINVEHLDNGSYFIVLFQGEKSLSQKLIIEH